jgi:hypothetical protein
MCTKEQIEVLRAVFRGQKGSWETINKTDAESCIDAGLLVQRGVGYQLTRAGQELIEKDLISSD